MTSASAPGLGPESGQKRARSWEVDISLEELVSWDVLEQFMQEIPVGSGDCSPLLPGLMSETGLGQVAGEGFGSLTGSSLGVSSDPLLLRGPRGVDTAAAALQMSMGSAGYPSWLSGSEGAPPRGGADEAASHTRRASAMGAPGASAAGAGARTSSSSVGAGASGSSASGGEASGSAAGGGASGAGGGSCSDALRNLRHSGSGYNAASLAQSLYGNWGAVASGGSTPSLQPGQSMMGSVSWGAELLPSILGAGEGDPATFGGSSPEAGLNIGMGADTSVSCGRPVQKTRFVWTAELHQRFEAAVNTLGIDHAKPQAISQLMNCEGEGAPTRQNIKSHLQKYRLLMQKRARQGPGTSRVGSGGADGVDAKKAEPSGEAGPSGEAEKGLQPQQPPDAQSQLEQHLARQEMNLKVQMELQTKLHRQLLVQRQLQHQLDHSLNSPAELDSADKQRWQATLSLKNNLRERLTQHVMMQQEMLHHLDALVSSEVNKPSASGEETLETSVPTAPVPATSAPAAGGGEQPAGSAIGGATQAGADPLAVGALAGAQVCSGSRVAGR